MNSDLAKLPTHHLMSAALHKFLEIDDDLWDRTYDLNVKGTLYAMQESIPHMLERGQGVIVNVASMAARMGGPGKSPHYASAKGAVDTLTMGAAREFAGQGIRVLSISPAIGKYITSPEIGFFFSGGRNRKRKTIP